MATNETNNYIPIVYTLNDKYIIFALTSMVSIAENTESYIDFNIIYSNLSENSIKKLESIKKYQNCKITYKKIDDNIFVEAGALARLPYYPTEVYYKMIIPDLLSEYDKAIFFDSDTLCLCDVRELFDFDISNVLLGAVQDVWYPEGRDELPLKSKCYFNCGTMLFNCKKMREENFCSKALSSLKDNNLMHYSSEEGILNQLTDENKLALPLKYNYLEPWWNNRINYTGDKLNEYNEVRKNPGIIHFTGTKPDKIESLHSKREDWWRYAKKTCCCEEILEKFRQDAIKSIEKSEKEIKNYQSALNEIQSKVSSCI